jgi:glycosyltransferase involved in cell wall biosynthesis
MPSVDVVIPNYQYGRYLRECVDSILSQGVSDLRVLIIDNASTDNSLEVARQLAAEDKRVEVVAHARNVGATASYNEGIDWASAEYFIELDADDLLAPGCLSRALACLEANPNVTFTYGLEAFRLPDGTTQLHPKHSDDASWQVVPGGDFIARTCSLACNHVDGSTVVRRTAVQKRVGYYRPSMTYADDLEMWLRLASAGDVATFAATQGIRRIHSAQISEAYRSNIVLTYVEYEKAFDSFFMHDGYSISNARRMHAIARYRIAERAYWSAIYRFIRGDRRVSYDLFKFAIGRFPSMALAPPFGFMWRMEDGRKHKFVELLSEAGRRLTSFVPQSQSRG